ncbi:Bbp16 family capsid cement protein [Pectinatus frisingensis]|uniref:Bbp16 family capsid cement protein n=1 Tax=Pectinatus frisingensis TaxID=865 RepID=UPI0018C7C2AA|nr:hypothetical protein [Pectinatus frisingensis]
MIYDNELMFSDNQSLVEAVGTYDSTNVIDSGADGDTYSDPMFLFIKMGTAAVGTGASIAVNLLTDDDAAFGSATTIPILAATGVANLTQNAELTKMRLPLGMKQYKKLQYVISGAALTAGTITSALVPEVPTNY